MEILGVFGLVVIIILLLIYVSTEISLIRRLIDGMDKRDALVLKRYYKRN